MPNLIILIFVSLMVLAYLWVAFSIVYHFIRFGVGRLPKILALFFFIGSFILFSLAMLAFLKISWAFINTILQTLQII